MRTVAAAEPATITLMDGKERQFLLSKGGIKRLCLKFGVETTEELFRASMFEKLLAPMLAEAQLSTNGDRLSEEQIDDIFPMRGDFLKQTVEALLAVSMPDKRPTEAGTMEKPSAPLPPSSESGPSA